MKIVMRLAHHYPESLRPGVEVLDRVKEETSTKMAHSEEEGVTRMSNPFKILARPGRLERPTCGFVGKTPELPNLLKVKEVFEVLGF